jgi:hypothetical protein
MKHQANSLPTFGLPNQFWKNYDKYKSFFDFLASFRGNHAKFKTVLKSCILSNPELLLRINSRPLIFRCLGDIDVNFFESYASTSVPNAIYLPQQFEYARAGFFTADQLTALQKTKIMCEETGNFVVTTTLLTCIATIKQLCANRKAYSRFSDYVVQLKTNFRKANVSYSDNKKYTRCTSSRAERFTSKLRENLPRLMTYREATYDAQNTTCTYITSTACPHKNSHTYTITRVTASKHLYQHDVAGAFERPT